MNYSEIETNILATAVSEEEYSLNRLQYWLQYGKHTWLLGAGVFWLPYSLVLTCVMILAIVFTPYMLWHLFKAKWYKSIIVFLIIVVLPFAIFLFIQTSNTIYHFLFMFLSILDFYLFTYFLSYNIGEKLTEMKALKKWDRETKFKDSY